MKLPNWERRISEARKNGAFTRYDVSNASNWMTCAIGERIKLLSRKTRPFSFGFRQEFIEKKLGTRFFHAVEDGDVDEAELILKQIEALE